MPFFFLAQHSFGAAHATPRPDRLGGAGAALLLAAILAGSGLSAAQAQAKPQQSAVIDRPGLSGEDFSGLSRRLMPSVVNISTRQSVARGSGLPAFPKDSPLNEFNEFFGRGDEALRRQGSLGSGFIIDAEGHVVTNNHVIEGADEIDVVLSDGSTLEAKLIGVDTETDLALLKVTTKEKLAPVPWGDSDQAQVGEWVLAIGNPFGLGGTVTAGIISARNRDISQGTFDDFIQTDAAINRGNSGGPLFNLKGEVVGINTAIFSPGESGGSVGVGFSVPANLAKAVIGQIKQYGATRRGTMGLKVHSVDQAIAEAYGLKKPEGAIVTGIDKGGPGEAANLKVGDLITSVNNQPVKETRDLARILSVAEVGSTLSIRYLRGGRPGSTSLVLVEGEKADKKAVEQEKAVEALSNVLGVSFRPIEDADRRRRAIPRSIQGVIVDAIDAGSDAAGKIRVGAVVTEVNFQPVTSPEQALEVAKAAAATKKPILLQIWGDGEVTFVSVRAK